jgi:chloride channel protein, CIC family
MATVTVGAVMEPVRGRLSDTTTMLDAANALSRAPHGQLPVLDDHGRYRGIVTAHAVADAIADGEHDQQTIASIVELRTPVSIDDRLEHALDTLDGADGAIPVLDADHYSLVGWLTHQRVLAALRRPTEPLTPASAPSTDHPVPATAASFSKQGANSAAESQPPRSPSCSTGSPSNG